MKKAIIRLATVRNGSIPHKLDDVHVLTIAYWDTWLVDALLSRPLSTELTVDVDDFDQYGVKGNPVINFALKEFKVGTSSNLSGFPAHTYLPQAIITVAENISAPLSAAFSTGGSPFLIALVGDLYTADFVIATHHFDGEPLEDVKREKSEPRRSDTASHGGNAAAAVAGPSNSSHKKAQPLFLPASQEASQRQEDFDEDDEFDALEMGEDDFAEIDRLSQMPPSTASERASSVMHVDGSHKRAKTLDNALIGGHQQQEDNEEHGELDLDAEEQDFDMAGGTTQVGPTPTPISQKLKLKNVRLHLYLSVLCVTPLLNTLLFRRQSGIFFLNSHSCIPLP